MVRYNTSYRIAPTYEPPRWRGAVRELPYQSEIVDGWLERTSFHALPTYVQEEALALLPEGRTPWWCQSCPREVRRCLSERTAPVAWERIDEVAAWPIYEAARSRPTSLLLNGDSGSGKSLAMWALARVIELKTRRAPVWKTALALARDLQAAALKLVPAERLMTCEYLFIDDLGKEKLTETVASNFWEVIDTRMGWGRPIVISTRFVGREFEGRFSDPRTGHDIVRRLREFSHPLTFRKGRNPA